jgi:hypothetical protein
MHQLRAAWKKGWPAGLFMFVILEIFPMIKNREFDLLIFLTGLSIWSLGALWVGHIIQRIQDKRK